MTDRERLARLEGLFHRAVDLAEDERLRLLEPLEVSDPELVAELRQLLDRADRRQDLSALGPLLPSLAAAPRFHPVMPAEPALPTESALPTEPAVVAGPYRLLERIGQGGMGEVYRAERADGQYAKIIAVKRIRPALVSSELVERFRRERQALARLEHANIARLLDAGLTATGAPYLAMEYVEGRPITDHCDAESLGIEARLALFCTVCRAVQHAHRNLIVHRDLKPSNILVTGDGEVKLLDFGLAKLLAADGEPAITRVLLPVMTPGYASPEQVRGEPVTTATDVYGLGLLLYELLCGRPAQNPRDGSLPSVERAVCEETPARPSEALSLGGPEEVAERLAARSEPRLGRLQRRLRGDLDTIVATALQKEPGRRYASAAQLAEDVERYLEGLPVRARRDSMRYRVGKLVRRHRLGLAAVAAVALSLILGLLLAVTGLVRAQRAERRALDEAAAAGQVSDFLVALFTASDPAESMGETVTARELLDRGVERIGRDLADQPAVHARLLGSMARAYEGLGLLDPALELVEERLGLESGPASPAALVDLARLHRKKGDYAGSRDLARRALELLDRSDTPDDRELSRVLGQLGSAHARLGELAEAQTALERALSLLERTRGPEHADLWAPLNNLAILGWMQGDTAMARARFERALAIAEREKGADHPSVAHLLNNLALVYNQAGDLERAIATHRRALAIREKVLDPDHVDVAESLNNLGDVLRRHGDLAEAETLLERALDIRMHALGPDHDHVASTLCNLGLTRLGRGDLRGARPLLERSVLLLERSLGPDHVMVSYPVLGLAHVESGLGDPATADVLFARSLALREAALEPSHPDRIAARDEYAAFLREQGRTAEAEALDRRVSDAASAGSE